MVRSDEAEWWYVILEEVEQTETFHTFVVGHH